MQRVQPRLAFALWFSALLLMAFFGAMFVGGPIDSLYRNAAGLSTARNAAQIAGLLAAAALLVAGLIIAIPTALQPAGRLRKVLYILPVYTLGFLLVGVTAAQLGIGTMGTLVNIGGIGAITFSVAWIALGTVLSAIAIAVAVASAKLSQRVVKLAAVTTTIAGALSLIATIAMVASVVIVSGSQPSFGRGGDQGRPPGQANVQSPGNGGTGQSGQSQPNDQSGQTGGQGGQGGRGGQNQPGGQNRPPDGGFRPGGPGGGANFVNYYKNGGILMAVFAVVALGGVGSTLRGLRRRVVEPTAATLRPTNYRREVASAIFSGVALTVVLLAVSQLMPVSRTNPPVQRTITWDSAQTQSLVERACMNCHSNETEWPWYAYVAPASWLTTIHVTNARQQFNLSENSQRGSHVEEMVQQIRSGTMPPKDYLLLHPEAQLTDAEKAQLIQGLQASLGGS